jgi:sterol desaturase/sphingolipid hydroxylase (fatty acid hydroxylase superfamily)
VNIIRPTLRVLIRIVAVLVLVAFALFIIAFSLRATIYLSISICFLFLLCLVLFGALEYLVPAHSTDDGYGRDFRTQFYHFFVNRFTVGFSAGLIAVFVVGSPSIPIRQFARIDPATGAVIPQTAESTATALKVSPWLLDYVNDLPFGTKVILALILADILFYWLHRALHKSKFLWRLHSLHHSPTELNWLSGHIQHPLEAILFGLVLNTPIYLMGIVNVPQLASVILVQTLHGIFIHSNSKIGFGPFAWLVVSPEYHHAHHSRDSNTQNSNFAAMFPWVDIIFGTYHNPKGYFPVEYGTGRELSDSYRDHLRLRFVDR